MLKLKINSELNEIQRIKNELSSKQDFVVNKEKILTSRESILEQEKINTENQKSSLNSLLYNVLSTKMQNKVTQNQIGLQMADFENQFYNMQNIQQISHKIRIEALRDENYTNDINLNYKKMKAKDTSNSNSRNSYKSSVDVNEYLKSLQEKLKIHNL